MKGQKDCWNPACVCWCNEPDTSNCMSEDIEPQDCFLADVDMRPIMNIFNQQMGIKKIEPPPQYRDDTLEQYRDDKPDRISLYYMHSNHLFTRLKGQTFDEIIEHCSAIRKTSYYGMLCRPILLQGNREIRRVDASVHCRGPEADAEWNHEIKKWKFALKNDPDVVRLIASNDPYFQL